MMDSKQNDFGGGYYSSISPLEQHTPKNALVAPSKNLLFDENGHPRSFNGFSFSIGGGSSTFYLDNGWAALGSHETTDVGAGNVFEYYNKSLIFVGNGLLKAFFPSVNPAIQSIGAASSIPQIAVLNALGTGWDTPKQLGLAPQGISPIITSPSVVGAGFVGLVSGVRAMKISAVRESTGGLSIASPASNTFEFSASTVLCEIPPARVDGSNKWRLYCTPSGFGNIGFYLQIPVEILESQIAAGTVDITDGNTKIKSTGNPRELEIEFNDTDLLDIQAPTDQFPATDASFVSAIGNVVILIGTFNGVGLSPSNPNQAEAFPPFLASFIDETIIGVSRPVSGFLYIFCRNSIWLAMMSGAVMGGSPIISRSFIQNIGITNSKATCTVGDDVYIFSAGRKPIRISSNGQYDMHFGDRIIQDMKTWNPDKVSVTFDDTNKRVLYSHQNEIIPFDIDYDRWNPPTKIIDVNGMTLSGFITSSYSKDGKSHIVYWDTATSTYHIGIYDKGTLGSKWIARESWDSWQNYRSTQDLVYVSALLTVEDAPKTITGKVFKNNETVANATFNFSITSPTNPIVPKQSVRSYFMNISAVELSGDGFGHRIIALDSDVDRHNIA